MIQFGVLTLKTFMRQTFSSEQGKFFSFWFGLFWRILEAIFKCDVLAVSTESGDTPASSPAYADLEFFPPPGRSPLLGSLRSGWDTIETFFLDGVRDPPLIAPGAFSTFPSASFRRRPPSAPAPGGNISSVLKLGNARLVYRGLHQADWLMFVFFPRLFLRAFVQAFCIVFRTVPQGGSFFFFFFVFCFPSQWNSNLVFLSLQ